MKEFKFKISADVADLEAQFKEGAKGLKALIAQAGKAESKLDFLKETGSYLEQIDAALTEIKTKHPDLFGKIFPNVDKQIKEILAPIRDMGNEIGKIFQQIGNRLEGMSSGKIEGSSKEFNEISKSINALAKTLGVKIDLKFLDDMLNKGAETKDIANALIDTLGNLAQSYYSLGKASKDSSKGINAMKAGGALKESAKDADELKGKLEETEKAAKKTKKSVEESTGGAKKTKNLIQSQEELNKVLRETNKLAMDDSDKGIDKYEKNIKKIAKSIGIETDKISKFFAANYDLSDDDLLKSFNSTFNKYITKSFQESEKQVGAISELKGDIKETEVATNSVVNSMSSVASATENATGDANELRGVLEGLERSAYGAGAATEYATNNVYEQIKSYEELNAVIKRYNELALKRISEGVGISKQEEDEMSSISNRLMKSFAGEDPDKSLDFLMKFNSATNQILGTIDIDKIANIFGIEIPQATSNATQAIGQVEQKIEDLAAEAAAAKKSFDVLTAEINNDLYIMTDVDIGRNTEGLDSARNKLKLLAEQGAITAEEMKQIDDVYEEANKKLNTRIERNKIERAESSGSYDAGYEQGYNDAFKNLDDDRDEYRRENETLKETIEALQKEIDTLRKNVSNQNDAETGFAEENQKLELLRQKLIEVEQAIKNKTDAFEAEVLVVNNAVDAEVIKLGELNSKLSEILNKLQDINKIDLNINTEKAKNEINELFTKLSDPSYKNEYLGLLNSKTGKISDEHFIGTDNRTEGTFKNKKDYDTMFHNHPDVSTAAASAADWKAFASEFEYFKRQIIITKDEIATFDLSGLTQKEMNEVAQVISSTLDAAKYDKTWVQDTQAYGKDEATQRWINRQTSEILNKYGIARTVQPTTNIAKNVHDDVSQSINIKGFEKLVVVIDSLQQTIKEAIGVLKTKSDAFKQEDGVVKDSVKKATKKKKESEKKEPENAPKKEVQDAETQAATEAKVNEELREQAELKDKLIKQQGTLNYLEKEAKGAEKILGETWSDGQSEEYEQMLVLINEYKKSKKLLSEEELQGIKKVVSGYQEQVKAINEAKAAEEKRAKDAKAAEEKAKNAYGTKELGKATNTIEKAYDYGAIYKDSTKVQAQLETVRKTYAQLEAAQKELANSTGVVTEEQKQAFRILVADFNKEYGTLNKIIKDSENLIAKSRFTPVDVDPSVAADMNKLEAVMKQAVEAGEEGKVRFGQFNATLQTMEYQVKDTNGQWVTFLARLDSTGTKVVAANAALKKTNTLLKDIASSTLSKIKSAIGNITGYDLIYRLVNVTKQGIQYVREIDSALTELKKVTDETEESYRNFLQTASKTAAAVGSTVKDITTMTADWARLGYSLEQASSLAESTAVLLNVSEFSDANQASEALISTIQAYGYAADESMSVVDVLNEVGKFIARR